MVEKMSYNPAKVLGIDKGSLAPGKIADLVIADPKAAYKIDKNSFVSKGKYTISWKRSNCKVELTMVNGNIVFENF